MKKLLEQLTLVYGAAVAIEESMPALADDCTQADIQDARDLLISISEHLKGIELEVLGQLPPMQVEYEIIDCAVGLSPLEGSRP